MKTLNFLGGAARSAFTGPGAWTRVAAAAAVVATVATQHYHITVYNRVQSKDQLSLIPNWRFFAPEPGVHDYAFIYRTTDVDGVRSRWQGVDLITGRKMRQLVWFPTRRPEKAVFDLATELLHVIDKDFAVITRMPAYRLLERYLVSRIRAADPESRVVGHQIAMVKSTGYDNGHEPQMVLLSPYTPLDRVLEQF
ncbi:hypothetical protein [Streptomyces sp. DG1A-41]|uniref:hypothetical protein n=1 Tax=Streptomyces sp. DG1A-41 TaxID=3125779 RepID=UPI0030D31DFD